MKTSSISRADLIALLFGLMAILVNGWIANNIFEDMAHLEDEFAYLWQAQVIAKGELTVESPPHPGSFLVPFVVDYQGHRFGKYPLGWPVILSFGVRLGMRNLVNPILSGLSIWLIYQLGKRVFGETVGLLAAGLTLTSPFFLINSGSLLSHPWGLFLASAFALSWMDAFGKRSTPVGWLPIITAGMTLGVLALSRPWTMISIALPFGIHGITLLIKGDWRTRKQVLVIGVIALILSSMHFLWQYAVTGDFLMNPYTLWWKYDKVGFGPGFGVTSQGHNLELAWINTKHSLRVGMGDLFGWGRISWLFLPFGLWAIRRRREMWAIAVVFPSLVIFYMAYWVGAWLFGPRYYYEGLFSLALLSAVGIAWLAGWPLSPEERWKSYEGWKKVRPLGTTALVTLLIGANLIFYAPHRIDSMRGLYSIDRSQLEPFLTTEAKALTPALVFVNAPHWMRYGALLELTDPFFDTPFIFVYGDYYAEDIIPLFPERKAFYYYTDEPYTFYLSPRPDS
ncbi:MAG: glycosyltransferase family 39 protein [Anaerolineales bacterium]|nr:glycosyltransferase family 39 protein [Anaerolineales bacterium]